MILYLLGASRQIRRTAITISLLLSAVCVAFADPLPAPTVLSAGGQCPTTTVKWTAVEGVRYYMVLLNGPISTMQLAFGTETSFMDLEPGTYSVMVMASSASPDSEDSPFSMPFSFTVRRCGGCVPPTVAVNTASPSSLWPPNGQTIPVSFAGTVSGITADCQLDRARYSLVDSEGGKRSGGVSVDANGNFSLSLSLCAKRASDGVSGRSYTLTVMAENDAGSGTSTPVVVTVPHDQGH
jgi:hypothetical protein